MGELSDSKPGNDILTEINQDTYRAEWAWLILFAPERVPGMVTSMLNDFKEVGDTFVARLLYVFAHKVKGGWLPMWKNIIGEFDLEINPPRALTYLPFRNQHHGQW